MEEYTPRSQRRGIVPEKDPSRTERLAERAIQVESVLYRRSPVLAAFLAGALAGYVVGAW